MPTFTRRVLGAITAVAVIATAGLAVVRGLGPEGSEASSHREAPITAADPQIDNTDVYAFVSPDVPDSVTLISNWIPFEAPTAGPNFFTFAQGVQYDLNVDNDADAKADITYRWEFKNTYRNPNTFLYNTGPVTSVQDETLNFVQTYTLTEIKEGADPRALVTDAVVVPAYVGDASMPDYQALRREGIVSVPDGGKTFVGPADDPFFLDLRVFDLLYGADLKEVGNDTLTGYNVHTMALQLPAATLAKDGDAQANPIIGVWSTAQRQTVQVQGADGKQTSDGEFVQVSRLGNPLVNEVVVPVGSKDYFNGSKPQDDGQFLGAVQDPELPKLIESVYDIEAPAAPRDDLVAAFLTGVEGLNQPPNVTPSEQLRLNMSIAPTDDANRLGVIGGDTAGFPNGRRLSDDVVDIALRVVEGELRGTKTELGDGVDANDIAFTQSFPYVAMPHSGSAVATPAADEPAAGGRPEPAAEEISDNDDATGWQIATAILGIAAVLLVIALVVRRRPEPPAGGRTEGPRETAGSGSGRGGD